MRRVFFSFHYDHDIWRANQVRNSNVVAGPDVAGFFDCSEYEDARRRRLEGIRRMILRHLEGTSVTVVLIGTYTASRPWVQFEIAESVKRGNGLVGISIHHLPGGPPFWQSSPPGPVPIVPLGTEMPVYYWDPRRLRGFAQVIEEAAQRAERRRRAMRAQKHAVREMGTPRRALTAPAPIAPVLAPPQGVPRPSNFFASAFSPSPPGIIGRLLAPSWTTPWPNVSSRTGSLTSLRLRDLLGSSSTPPEDSFHVLLEALLSGRGK